MRAYSAPRSQDIPSLPFWWITEAVQTSPHEHYSWMCTYFGIHSNALLRSADVAARVNIGQSVFTRYPENLMNSRRRYIKAFQVVISHTGPSTAHCCTNSACVCQFRGSQVTGVELTEVCGCTLQVAQITILYRSIQCMPKLVSLECWCTRRSSRTAGHQQRSRR